MGGKGSNLEPEDDTLDRLACLDAVCTVSDQIFKSVNLCSASACYGVLWQWNIKQRNSNRTLPGPTKVPGKRASSSILRSLAIDPAAFFWWHRKKRNLNWNGLSALSLYTNINIWETMQHAQKSSQQNTKASANVQYLCICIVNKNQFLWGSMAWAFLLCALWCEYPHRDAAFYISAGNTWRPHEGWCPRWTATSLSRIA